MADKEEKEQKKQAKAQEDTAQENGESQQDGGKLSLVALIIMITVVITLSGSGFVLGRLIAKTSSPETDGISQENTAKPDTSANNSGPETGGRWYYSLNPVVANLDVPGVTRYVKATITMEMSSDWLVEIEGKPILMEKQLHLENWLAIYLASLTIEDVRGDRNLKRIQLHILDAFNEILFPDAKPQVKRILFKEGFAIQ